MSKGGKMQIAVIGAGPAGLTAAYQLCKQGHDVMVFEAGSKVGGLSKSIELWNCRVDLGPHRFFSSDREVNAFWLEAVDEEYAMVKRLTRIYYKNRFFDYPLKAFKALRTLGPFTATACLLSYFKQQILPTKQDGSFETWVQRRFGKRLYEIFFKSYSEKLWGISCRDLDADFAAQRIKKLSLFAAIWNSLKSGRGNKHKTLVDEFAYPIGGAGKVYEKLAEKIERLGGKIYLETKVTHFEREGKKILGLLDGEGKNYYCDTLVSTMPLTQLAKGLHPNAVVDEALAQLQFRNTILVYVKVERVDLFPDNWIYIHSKRLRTGRITNFRNWDPSLFDKDGQGEAFSILCLEYWCQEEDALWQMDETALGDLAKKDIQQSGLCAGSKISDSKVYRIPRCYPIYKMGYKAPLKVIQDFVDGFENLHAIGRYGAFKYNNQDHSILMGLRAARKIGGEADIDLWEINTDYESYQEESRITETGLQ